MKAYNLSVAVVLIGGLVASACDDEASKPNDREQETDSDEGQKTVFLAESNNYAYTSELTIPRVETAVTADIEICWDELTADFQCHEMDPATDIDNVTLIRTRNLTEEAVETALGEGDFQQSNIDGYLELPTEDGATCVNLADFTFLGSAVDVGEEYVVSEENRYLLVVTTGTTLGVGARMMTFMTPTPDSDNTSVMLGEGCDLLDFSADLTSLTPVSVSKAGIDTLDWSNLAIPGVTRVMLGFYEGMTAADLEEEVLDLMLIADRKWEFTIESRADVALPDFEDDEGKAFDGFEGEGSWVFALLCDTCQNPAPPFVTLLQPE